MALLQYFILGSLLVSHANAVACTDDTNCASLDATLYSRTCDVSDQTCNCADSNVKAFDGDCFDPSVAVTTCTDNGDCSGTGAVGNTCETLTDGTTQQCNCGDNYSRVDDNCVVNNRRCANNGGCTAVPVNSDTCSSSACDCGSGYEKDGNECKVKPAKPTLTVTGVGPTELISGTDYTLSCESTGAPGNIPYAYTYFKGNDEIASATLSAVTQTANGGDYKCRASYDGVNSEDSDVVTISVKPAKPTLTETGGTPLTDLSVGGSYTLVCTSANAPAGTTSTFSKDGSEIEATLTSVSSTDTNGEYTCRTTAGGIDSDPSDAVSVAVNAAGTYCSGPSDCSGIMYTGVCTSDRCVCESDYAASGTSCALRPEKPTLSVAGGHVSDDLSLGGSYTLDCTSDNAADGTIYAFYKGTTRLDDGSLSAITSNTAGSYTCRAISATGVESEESDALTVGVGAAGKYCTDDAGCTAGNGFTGTCASNRCSCSSDYKAVRDTCSSAVQAATISMFSILFAFMVSKFL